MQLVTLFALLIGALAHAASAALVIANFELLYAETYTTETWKADIASAKAAGIDGFALVTIPPNCQSEGFNWQASKIKDAYAIAGNADFKIIPAFDMTYHSRTSNCPTGMAWNMTYMSTLISTASKQSATFLWNDAVLVIARNGGLYGDDYLSQTKSLLERQGVSISIAPYLNNYVESAHRFGNPEQSAKTAFSDYPSIDGFFNEMAWPDNVRQNLTCEVDNAFKGAIKNAGRTGPYIMAVSPWYYENRNTNNPADSRVQYSDTLWDYRWKGAITETKPDIVNIVSWNSWNTSTYLRDVPEAESTAPGHIELGEQGNYIYGMNHSAWRTMSNYYSQYYKAGQAPEAKTNELVYWYRVHRKDAQCQGGQTSVTGAVQNSDFPNDSVFIWASARANLEIEVYFGNDAHTQTMRPGSPKLTFTTSNKSGPQLFELPFPDDFPLNGTDALYPHVLVYPVGIHRIAYSKYDSVAITADCAWTNFNPVVQSLGPGFNDIIG